MNLNFCLKDTRSHLQAAGRFGGTLTVYSFLIFVLAL